MSKGFPRIEKYVVASDVSDRDGIGMEVYENDEIVLEIFRDDYKKTREITLYKKNIDLEVVEQAVELFKKEIPWKFLD